MTKLVLPELTEVAIGAAMEVATTLGGGFLEKIYERALAIELQTRGHNVCVQQTFSVRYKDQLIGEYAADLVMDDALILELKCVEQLGPAHVSQCMNYLKASGLEVALLLNFQRSRLEWKRVVLSDPR